MKPIIRIDNLGKQYRIGARRTPYLTLRDSLSEAARWPLRWLRREQKPQESTIWALKDVSLEIQPGEVVGIIGRNGAGKSTLLKVLSRITEPTTGQVDVYGRVGSLLEVGTGFHGELTGRENVYLNGAILGMSRAEISRKFDEIVAFSEVEKFLDTPVKHYSSGMQVRLAFAVAAHLEPEILIVDEVLAVGDASFQKKCLGKMTDVSRQGRTVLFVSHNMGAIQGLCNRGILIESGEVLADDALKSVIEQYFQLVAERGNITVSTSPKGSYPLDIRRVFLKDSSGQPTTSLAPGASLAVEIHYQARVPLQRPNFWVGISSQFGALLGASMLFDGHCPERLEGEGVLSCVFPHLPLLPQTYSVHVGVRDSDGMALLAPSTEVGHFNIVGCMRDHGFPGPVADVLAWNSSPMILPYAWHLQDGKVISVPGFTQMEN